MSRQDWVALRYVKSLLATDFGRQNQANLLAKALIDEGLLTDPGAMVSKEQYSRLVRVLMIATRDESFGFTRHGLKLGTFAMMCQTIINTDHLEQAIKICNRFYRLVTDDFHLQLRRTQDLAAIELVLNQPLAGPVSFFTEAIFAMLLRLFSWLIDKPIQISRMEFAFAPEESGYSFEGKILGQVCYRQSTSSMYFPASLLLEDIRHDRIELKELLEKETHRFLTDFRKEDSFSSRIRNHLMQDAGVLTKSLDSFARDFGISPSSLRRKLREEGQNFHDLRESLRKQRSLYFLNHTHKSIDAIALAMGYSESSTFHRAFKKWTGFTPLAYRQRPSAHCARDLD
jgi:AraC-like DNA-binding protein